MVVVALGVGGCSAAAWELIGDIVLGPPSDPCVARPVMIDPSGPIESAVLELTDLRLACLAMRGLAGGS